MKLKSNLVWGFCFLGLFACGCSSSQNIVRGQNAAEPLVPGPAHAYPVGSTYSNHMADGWTPNSGHHSYGYQYNGSSDCDQCENGGECKSSHCRGNKHAHRHHYHYDYPKDLVYPQQNQPAAVVQYPYYTVKGPDDFFLK